MTTKGRMIVITKKTAGRTTGQAVVGVWKSTHKRLAALSAATGRSMAEIVDIAVSHIRVGKNAHGRNRT